MPLPYLALRLGSSKTIQKVGKTSQAKPVDANRSKETFDETLVSGETAGVLAPGQSVGNYRILSRLGSGGMGVVYLAEHPLIGKKVALKVIHADLARNREVVLRFFREAKAVNQIGHEHIVSVHDFGQTDDSDYFYIMEYLEGITLAKLLVNERVLPTARAFSIGAQIAAGLGAAHAAGVIHRDLKPDNVMLVTHGRHDDYVKILDFGLAKSLLPNQTSLTAQGVVLGTPQFMSPEACESKADLDHRTDIYALGILLYQMVTGRLPFDGESMGEVLVKQVTTLPLSIRAQNSLVTEAEAQVIFRCLQKRADDRFATMGVLQEALRDPAAYWAKRPPQAPSRAATEADKISDVAPLVRRVTSGPDGGAAVPSPQLPLPAPSPTLGTNWQLSQLEPAGGRRTEFREALTRFFVREASTPAVATATWWSRLRPHTWGLLATGLVGLGVMAWLATRDTGLAELSAPVGPLAGQVAVEAPVGPLSPAPPPAAVAPAPLPTLQGEFTVQIRTTPTQAWVLIDGQALPTRTPATVKLPRGMHKLTLRKPGFVSRHRVIAVQSDVQLDELLRRRRVRGPGSDPAADEEDDGDALLQP